MTPGDILPDPDPPKHPPNAVNRSVQIRRTDGSTHSYPSLDDYIAFYVSQGIVTDLDDLIRNYDHLIGELFFNWIYTGQVACAFAVKLAKKPRESRWLSIVHVGGLADGESLGDILNARLDAASDSYEAAAVILPDVRTPDEVVQFVNLLCADPSGRWYRSEADMGTVQGAELIGLRWILKSDKSVNLVLGFAPIDTMPATRRSPFTALFLRIRDEKRAPKPELENGRLQVHLADLDSTFESQDRHDRASDQTKKARALQVEPDLTGVARARVTFSVPSEAGKLLGPARRVVLSKPSS